MDKFEEARITIACIDKQIAELFEKRMDAVKDIADYKKEHNLPIFDEQREKELLLRNSENINNNDYLPYYVQFQQNMMNVSKSYQEKLINTTEDEQ